ncbi:MAG TPA: DUF1684 domain-containing protein [Jatrophihabitantaceae bacterium]|nr:DUF1684 domain-containing protein [Jatrophihabitantaceae bacterium]
MTAQLELADWRRRIAELYARIRATPAPEAAHELWRTTRDELFRTHPQSPLRPDDSLRGTGLPYWPYDPTLRFTVLLEPAEPVALDVPTSSDATIHLRRIGRVELLDAGLDVWWLEQYGGGIFVPLRDGTAGTETYGAGRYLLDTAKGADLGGTDREFVLDLNFAYHPSCRYNPLWECPLAPEGNRLSSSVCAGERL